MQRHCFGVIPSNHDIAGLCARCKAFIRFHGLRHPAELRPQLEVEGFLEWLATERQVAHRPTPYEGSVPCGFDSHKLPIGLQIVSRPGEERTVLAVAHRYEQHANLGLRHPIA
jgi:hypothetical protein